MGGVTEAMAAVGALLADEPDGLSGNAIETQVQFRRDTVRKALEELMSDGYITHEGEGRTSRYRHLKPYPEGS